jgi:hypothetical protein
MATVGWLPQEPHYVRENISPTTTMAIQPAVGIATVWQEVTTSPGRSPRLDAQDWKVLKTELRGALAQRPDTKAIKTKSGLLVVGHNGDGGCSRRKCSPSRGGWLRDGRADLSFVASRRHQGDASHHSRGRTGI